LTRESLAGGAARLQSVHERTHDDRHLLVRDRLRSGPTRRDRLLNDAMHSEQARLMAGLTDPPISTVSAP